MPAWASGSISRLTNSLGEGNSRRAMRRPRRMATTSATGVVRIFPRRRRAVLQPRYARGELSTPWVDILEKHGAQIWTSVRTCTTVRAVYHDRSLRGCGACATTRPPVAAGGHRRLLAVHAPMKMYESCAGVANLEAPGAESFTSPGAAPPRSSQLDGRRQTIQRSRPQRTSRGRGGNRLRAGLIREPRQGGRVPYRTASSCCPVGLGVADVCRLKGDGELTMADKVGTAHVPRQKIGKIRRSVETTTRMVDERFQTGP